MSDTPPPQPCNGYWYNVNIKTSTAGPAWKCISQAEYNTVMTQQAHDDQVGGMIVLGILAISSVGFLAWFAVHKLRGKS